MSFEGVFAQSNDAGVAEVGKLEALLHLGLDEERGTLEAPVSVLLVDCAVMLVGILATVEDGGEKVANLRVGVVGIVDVTCSPITLAQHHTGQAVGTGSGEAGGAVQESLVTDGDLQEVLGQSSGLEVVVISLADASQEAHWTGPAQFELQHTEHKALSLEDFILRVTVVDHVHDLLDGRAVDFLILGSKEESSSTDQLELAHGDDLDRQEAVNVVDSEEQGLRQELETMVDLDNPVYQNGAHGPLDVLLELHVVSVGAHTFLWYVK